MAETNRRILVMPVLIDTSLVNSVGNPTSTPTATISDPTSNASASNTNGSDGSRTGTDGNNNGPLIDALVPVPTEVPMPTNGSLPTDDATADEDPVLNRAARRAQQRDDAQVKRTRARR